MKYLRRSKPKEIDYQYGVFDIETSEKDGSALLGEPNYISWSFDGSGHGVASDDLTGWLLGHFLTPQKDGWILYCHNGFNFDYKRIKWEVLAEKGYTAHFVTGNDSSIKSVTIMQDEYTWKLRDSYLLINLKLEKVTKTFAPKHQKIKRKDSFDVRPFDPSDASDVEYAIQDSVGLYHAIATVDSILQEQFNVSIHESSTLPALAFKAFRRSMRKGEKYPGIAYGAAMAARQSYHGGQTIAFRSNEIEDVVSLDANSMYSYCMLAWRLPTGDYRKVAGLPSKANPNRCLCLAVVHIPEGVFPYLKAQDDTDRVGNFNGAITGWYWLFELEKQKELGGDYKVIETYVWNDDTNAANRFNLKCRKLRMLDYFGPMGTIAKLIANSLYGKFAQQVAEFMLMLSLTRPSDESLPFYDPQQRDTNPYLWQVPSGENHAVDLTHWASFITARSRWLLTTAIQRIGFDNVIYCDTDSIFFERKHIDKIGTMYGKEYGQFKIEKGSRKQGISFQAVAPKSYRYFEEGKKAVKNKGIPTNALTKQGGFEALGEGKEIKFIQSNSLVSMMKDGKGYGRQAHRKMATIFSTTNGEIKNDVWIPSKCVTRKISKLRYDSTSFLLQSRCDRIIEGFLSKGGVDVEREPTDYTRIVIPTHEPANTDISRHRQHVGSTTES